MKTNLRAAAILLLVGSSAIAHRLDEYLQATLISVGKDRVEAEIRLAPGIAVLPIVLATMDSDADGVISPAEQRKYAERVLRDLLLTVDGSRLPLRLVSTRFPEMDELKEGRGEIQLEVMAEVPRSGPKRRLTFENRHQPAIAAYLVNCEVPRDGDIRITAQDRNYQQSFYQLDYAQAGVQAAVLLGWLPGVDGCLGACALAALGFLFALRARRAAKNDGLPYPLH